MSNEQNKYGYLIFETKEQKTILDQVEPNYHEISNSVCVRV